jgi:cytochrome c oxidase cbb3-type subunit 3
MSGHPSYVDAPEGGFDGIHEYDNPCPLWWSLIFLGTFIFSVQYVLFFHAGTFGWTLDESYQAAVVDNLRLRFAEIGELTPDEPTLLAYMGKKDWLVVGAATYKGSCKSCHGEDGSGLVGPNLTDDHFKNVKQLTDIARVVEEGAANLTMPAWRDRLHRNEIVLVAAYVATLRGQNLPGKRGPEGVVIPPWPTASATRTGPTEPAQPSPPVKSSNADAAPQSAPSPGEAGAGKT